uniref:Uncharacterized protein n=1 Tax=Cacopsylla melanoneura TaxID=428564 RepID=A0A8D8QZF4_9HEMI
MRHIEKISRRQIYTLTVTDVCSTGMSHVYYNCKKFDCPNYFTKGKVFNRTRPKINAFSWQEIRKILRRLQSVLTFQMYGRFYSYVILGEICICIKDVKSVPYN